VDRFRAGMMAIVYTHGGIRNAADSFKESWTMN
jgi:hypothetical protein